MAEQEEFVEEYLNKRGLVCPFCGSNEIEALGLKNALEPDAVRQNVHCATCARTWTDIYKLSDIEY